MQSINGLELFAFSRLDTRAYKPKTFENIFLPLIVHVEEISTKQRLKFRVINLLL